MQFTSLPKSYHVFLSETVRRIQLELEGEEGCYPLKLSLVSLPPEGGTRLSQRGGEEEVLRLPLSQKTQ